MRYRPSPKPLLSVFSLKVATHQIPAVVLPQSGNDAGAGFPQQAEAEAAVNMHPDLFFRQTSLPHTHKSGSPCIVENVSFSSIVEKVKVEPGPTLGLQVNFSSSSTKFQLSPTVF